MKQHEHAPLASGTLYTVGYAHPGTAARIDRLMRVPSTLLLDIRYRPRSRWHPEWNLASLARRYGMRYLWDERLGNVNYQHRDKGIALAPGHEEAVQEAAARLYEGTSLILLCACKYAFSCHRTLVAKLIQDALLWQEDDPLAANDHGQEVHA